MSKYKVYHNPRCSKSRMALDFLDQQNKEYETIEYLKEIPTELELKKILKMLKIRAEDLVRKGEPDYKEYFKEKNLSEDQWIKAMLEYPKLIERPIVILGDKAVIARPTENINMLK